LKFDAYYSKKRFNYIDKRLSKLENFNYCGDEKIKKTACLYGENINVYIDTSDGVNDDLAIQEYCGRMLNVIKDSKGKPFLFFKSAFSNKFSNNIVEMARENKGKVHPFFKWSFNNDFYTHVLSNRDKFISRMQKKTKKYDIGIFCGLKPYKYPKASSANSFISWSDHEKFNIPGSSENTGFYTNQSRKILCEKLQSSNFKVLHLEKVSYLDYLEASFECRAVFNPPGMGEYTSRMVDQSFLGGCVFLRKNSYDNGHTWKNHIPEIDFKSEDWEVDLKNVVDNYKFHGMKCKEYFDNFWTSEAVADYLVKNIRKDYFFHYQDNYTK